MRMEMRPTAATRLSPTTNKQTRSQFEYSTQSRREAEAQRLSLLSLRLCLFLSLRFLITYPAPGCPLNSQDGRIRCKLAAINENNQRHKGCNFSCAFVVNYFHRREPRWQSPFPVCY